MRRYLYLAALPASFVAGMFATHLGIPARAQVQEAVLSGWETNSARFTPVT